MAKKGNLIVTQKNNLTVLALLAGILAFTGLLYFESLQGRFLNYDDTDNVVNNPMIRQFSAGQAGHIFSHSFLYMYTPLAFISYAADYAFSGAEPFFFRLTNLLLHLLNVALVFMLANRLIRKTAPAGLVALLFALHPMNPDTVSWISARSNLLSTLFFLLCLLAYLRYLRNRKIAFYLLVIPLFLLSLLSKPSGLMLPVVLLLADYLEKRRLTLKVILEKVPLVVLSLLFGLVTLYFRSDAGSPQAVAGFNPADRVFMIGYTSAGYLVHAIFPWNLSAVYAYPLKHGVFLPVWFYMAPVFLAGVGSLVFRATFLKREMIFGLLFFFVNILVTQAALLEDGFMANRDQYLPGIGLFFIIGAVAGKLISRSKATRYILLAVTGIYLLYFSVYTRQRSLVWTDTLTLFDDAVKHEPGSAFALNNRGIARYSLNDQEGALEDYSRAIVIYPGYSGAFYNRGIVFYDLKDFARARQDYTAAIGLNPRFASSYMARGILEMDVLQDSRLAMEDYNHAISLNPGMARAYYNRGILWLRMKETARACDDFHQVRRLGYDRADDLISRFCE